MVKVFNPVRGRDPVAETLNSLGKSMFGDQLAASLNQEKLYASQRENTEMDNLMRRTVEGGGAQVLGSDPLAQAMMIGSGFDPANFGELGLMGAATQFGARDPRTQNWQVGTGQSFDNTAGAFDLKLGETRRNNDMQSSDRRYGVDQSIGQQMHEFNNIGADQAVDNAEIMRNNDVQSADRRYGVDQSVGQQRDEFNLAPKPALGPDGLPTFVPQGELAGGGFAPIISETDQKGTLLGQNFDNLPALNPNQQEVLGARLDGNKSGTPKNYIMPGGKTFITLDGMTDAQSGQSLPPGGFIGTVQGGANEVGVTNAVATDLQSDTIANKKFNFLVEEGLSLTNDPTLFGPQGFARSLAQEAMAGFAGTAALFAPGTDGNAALQAAQQDLRASGMASLIPELYNPNLPKVQTIWGLLLYQGAAALAGQENRSVSDKDIDAMKNILGSPQSLFSSAEMMRSKLQTAKSIVAQFDTISREALGGAAPVTPSEAPAGGAPIDDLVNKYRSR